MNEKDYLFEELKAVQGQIDAIVDQMIEKFGKFVTIDDIDNDITKANLVRNYNALLNQKLFLIAETTSR